MSRENFATWLAASRREAQEPVAGELLPCPFCGGAAETDSQQAYRNISTGRTETAVAVYCTSCGAQHTICRGDVPGAELSDVTELWNKRAAPPSPVPAPAGEVERLTPNERFIPRMLLLDDLHAVCVGGRWDGWKFFKHPDGQWVSLKKLEEQGADDAARAALNGGLE